MVDLLIFTSLAIFASSVDSFNATEGLLRGKDTPRSLFSVVRFKNTACTSNSLLPSTVSFSENKIYRSGTCMTENECSNTGGSAAGKCALGFGMCCIYTISTCSADVTQNCTYVRNPSFPQSEATLTNGCTYNVKKCSDNVCSLRLDFESFSIQGPDNTDENDGGECSLDKFEVTTSSGRNVPTICGYNSAQHMYVDIGCESDDMATLKFDFDATSTTSGRQRTWEIKVTQIECNSNYRPNDGCLQWHTGVTGRIKTFNFDQTDKQNQMHLAAQEYNICINQEEGYCCIRFQPCYDQENPFTIEVDDADDPEADNEEGCNSDGDFITILGGSTQCGHPVKTQKYCGSIFSETPNAQAHSSVCSCTPPFMVGITTDETSDSESDEDEAVNRGVCLDYRQIPCGLQH